MPVTIDYYTHATLHPVPHRAEGKIDPADDAPARSRVFGPESRLVPDGAHPRAFPAIAALSAELAAFRAAMPRDGATWLALTKPKKPRPIKTARGEDWLGGENGAPVADAAPREAKQDRTGIEDQDGGYRLNFEDADVKDVLQAVLGKVLGLNYTIAPNVMGHVTISSAAPQSRTELLSTMETVLSGLGLSLTKSGSLYRVVPTTIGGGTLDATGSDAGFGISVVPIEYTSVASMLKLLSGFVVEADGIRIDTAQNAVIVRGPGPRRAEIVRAIKAFDGDWMHQQSVSVFELRRSRPDDVISELTRIFDADSTGEASGVIQFKAIRRLRSIMVISKNDLLIRRAGAWIRRLDHQDPSATNSIFVYRPRYRDAKELAKTVNSVFGQDQADTSDTGSQQAGPSSADQSSGPGGQSQTIGMSSASFAGSLTAPGTSSGGVQGTGQSGSGAAPSTQQGAGRGNGLQGSLADPIEAGRDRKSDLGHLTLKADSSNNTIVAYTDGETYAKVQSVLRQLDLPPLQVAINVIVAEVQLNDELKYGIQFYLNNKAGSLNLSQAASTFLSTQTGFNLLVNGASSPDVVISALDSISKVHILSTPSVVVMENKSATFEVGDQVPVVTQQATSNLTAVSPTLNQVQYLDTGIILKITPRVGQNGDVAMQLDQVISSVVPDSSGSTTNSLTPTISKRRIASDISVKSGQSVLLAGLISDTRSQVKGQIPFLGGVSDLLGNKDNSFARNELVVFIRPVIIRDGQDATSVAAEFRTHLRALNVSAPPVTKP